MKIIKYALFIKNYLIKEYPIEVTFFVTSKCNFRCKHCFYWKSVNKKNAKELKLEEIIKISKNMPPLLRLLISGGEPFLREELPQICEAFSKNAKTLHITIPTNASMPDLITKKTEEIAKLCPKTFINLSLSLDQLGKKRDSFVGVKDGFENFKKTYYKIKQLKKIYKNLAVGVITTLTADNQKDIIKIYEYATKKLNVDNFGFNVVRGMPRDAKIKNIDMTYFDAITNKMKEDVKSAGKMNFPLFNIFISKREILHEIYKKTRFENKFQIPCYSGKIRGVITENGDVYPCETFMYYKKDFNFGNLRNFNYDIKAIWKSKKAEKIRKFIKNRKCFCTHECDLTTNILFNPKMIPKLLFKALKSS